MSTIEEISEIPEKYMKYKDQLGEIFKKHEIEGIKSLVSKFRKDAVFRKNETALAKHPARVRVLRDCDCVHHDPRVESLPPINVV